MRVLMHGINRFLVPTGNLPKSIRNLDTAFSQKILTNPIVNCKNAKNADY